MTQTPEEKAIAEYSVHLKYIGDRLDSIEKKMEKRISKTDLEIAVEGAIDGHIINMHNNQRKDSVHPKPVSNGFIGSMNAAQRATFFSLILALISAATIAIQSRVSGHTVPPVSQSSPAEIKD